jgi:signal transduction histidine kinase
MKVLLAEDKITSRIIMEKWLSTWGYEPVAVADGLEGWNVINSPEPPRLAVLDWMMPNMDGLELCQKIKQTPKLPFIYTILVTSKSSKEDIVTGLDAGADDFLAKPVQPEELRSRLNVGVRILDYQQRLEELDAQKNKFLGMAAHDLRNPLGSIQGFSQLLLSGGVDDKTQREFLQIINNISQEMLSTVNDLLDISVIESGQLDISLVATDLAELIHYRTRLNALRAAQKNIQIEVLPMEKTVLDFDPERITQVLDNLISNAVKYSPPNTQIHISLQRRGGQVEISVQDQGPGIPEDKRDRLFGTFQRLGSKPTGGEKSIGLGLAIVKKIVESHHGQVGVDSNPGQGSRFFFLLPVAAGENASPNG